jgi:hypothetical protein
MKLIVTLIAMFLVTGCKKQSAHKIHTIKGQIFESTSNPIPVNNYTLTFYQKANSGLLGGVSGLDTTTKTDNDGKFSFQYRPDNFGFSTVVTNPNQISIEGTDTLQYKVHYSRWYPVPALTDTNLNTLYLYKKIQILVRKVQFNNSLNTGEKLDVITPNGFGTNRKTLNGPIASGTLVIVDTILNCKLSIFNLATNQYNLSSTLTKPSYLKGFVILVPKGDEAFREILMDY